jgi:alpha-beta hydrolase superfamily lysophospholipase
MIPSFPRIAEFACPDGYCAAVRVWEAREPRARLVLLHGIVSHGGWYAASCRALAEAGWEVHFLDRRGSGLNAERRGDVDRYETWLNDVESYLAGLPDSLPRLLLGISWGGKLAAAVARGRPDLLTGLGLLCPGLFARQSPRLARRTAVSAAAALRMGGRRVPVPLRDPALFTDDPRWQAYVRDDPLTLRDVTIRFAAADGELTRYARESPGSIRVPTLMVLAGRDRIVENEPTRAFFRQLGTEQRQLVEFPDAAHTLEFDAACENYCRAIVDWATTCVGR